MTVRAFSYYWLMRRLLTTDRGSMTDPTKIINTEHSLYRLGQQGDGSLKDTGDVQKLRKTSYTEEDKKDEELMIKSRAEQTSGGYGGSVIDETTSGEGKREEATKKSRDEQMSGGYGGSMIDAEDRTKPKI